MAGKTARSPAVLHKADGCCKGYRGGHEGKHRKIEQTESQRFLRWMSLE